MGSSCHRLQWKAVEQRSSTWCPRTTNGPQPCAWWSASKAYA